MKKVQILFGMLTALAWSTTTIAAPVVVNTTSSATTSSAATSNSVAIGTMGAPTANAAGGNSNSSLHATQTATGGRSNSSATGGQGGSSTSSATGGQGGNSTSSARGGTAAGGTATAAGGTATGGKGGQGVGSVTVKQNFAASKIPLQVPTVFAPSVPVPEIFSRLNAPTVVKGIPITEWYTRACDTTATRAHPLKDEYHTGSWRDEKYLLGGRFSISGDTDVTFSPAQGYYLQHYPKYGKKMPLFPKPVETQSVSIITPAQARTHKYVCLGLLTVVASKKGLPLSGIIADARIFPLGYMRGFRKVSLVLLPSAVAAALGVQTSGKSFSLVPSIVHAAASALTSGGAGASVSAGEGTTYSSAKLGATFLVLAPNKWYGTSFTLVK